jgi:hypothetical protein
MTGQHMLSLGDDEFMDRGEHILSINPSVLAPDAYLIELLTDGARLSRPFVVRR